MRENSLKDKTSGKQFLSNSHQTTQSIKNKTCTIAQSCFPDSVQAAHCGAVLLLACLDCFYQNHNYHLSIYSFKMNGALVVLSNWQAAR